MNYQTLKVDIKDHIATMIFNRPDKLNALSNKMADELLDALNTLDSDKNVRVVVVTGAGRAFCSGADIKDRFLGGIEERKRGDKAPNITGIFAEKCCLLMRNMTKPLIAAINGAAIGFGYTFTLACDIRIASSEAKIGLTFTRVGLIPEFGSTYLLPRLVGIGRACELIFTTRTVDAYEAEKIGLVNKVVSPDRLLPTAYDVAGEIVKQAPVAIELSRKGLYQGLDTDLVSMLQYESLSNYTCKGTADHQEAVQAFLGKREPVFKGV